MYPVPVMFINVIRIRAEMNIIHVFLPCCSKNNAMPTLIEIAVLFH